MIKWYKISEVRWKRQMIWVGINSWNVGRCGCCRPKNQYVGKNVALLQIFVTGVVWDLYNATYPSFPPSSTYHSLSLLSVPWLLLGRGERGPKLAFVNANCGSLYKSASLSSAPGRGHASRSGYSITPTFTPTFLLSIIISILLARNNYIRFTQDFE